MYLIKAPLIHYTYFYKFSAVKERNYTTATDLQIGLMVDHPSLCSQWMSGIRYMIQYGFETVDEPCNS